VPSFLHDDRQITSHDGINIEDISQAGATSQASARDNQAPHSTTSDPAIHTRTLPSSNILGTNTQSTSSMVQQIIPQYLPNATRSNKTWGASMDTIDPASTRIFFQNINGLRFATPDNRWEPHLTLMKERGIAISGFAETNINWNFRNIRSSITDTARKIFPNSVTSLSPNKYQPPTPSAYQPGG
jgi:hypothetical protein